VAAIAIHGTEQGSTGLDGGRIAHLGIVRIRARRKLLPAAKCDS